MAARPPSEIAAISGCGNSCNTSSTDDDSHPNLIPYDDPQSEFERSFLAFLSNNSHIWTFHDSHEEVEPAETTSTTTTSTSRFSRLTSLGSRLRSHSNHYNHNRTTSSRISISSAPVLVRAYTGPRSRDVSRARTLADTFLSSAAMRGRPAPTSGGQAGTSARAAATTTAAPEVRLPPVADFSFDGILRAVEPEIQEALDAIAAICARSRMSLADAHGAHLPPTGEITAEAPSPPPQPPRLRHWGLGLRTDVERMTSVPEVSSSSGSASKASSASGLGRKRSAMGSLRGIMSRAREASSPKEKGAARPPAWLVVEDQRHPSILLVSHALASKQLSLDTVAEMPPPAEPAAPQTPGWAPWRAPAMQRRAAPPEEEPRRSAENLLKGLLGERPPGVPG